MSINFPAPTDPVSSRTEVFLGYLDYFRSVVVDKLDGLPEVDLRSSRLPSGWTPLELARHLAFVERRWLVWGFEGRDIGDPWADSRDGRWYVGPEESVGDVVGLLVAQGETTRSVVLAHDLQDLGRPGDRWDGDDPPTLERILFHLVQEYARHAGHLDVVRELADGRTGEE